MSVHRAAQAFGGAAAAYDRARPDYPPAALDWLRETLDLGPRRTVVDLAAGTGKLTGPLARTRARVIAVDPSRGMLDRLRAALPDVEAHEAGADAIPLPDACADAVTVAQAFHWFANDEALAEIQRVLRPGGRLALVWNRRDLAARPHIEIERVVVARRGDTPSHLHGAWREVIGASERFDRVDAAELRFEQHLDRAKLIDRVLSISFIAALPDRERETARQEIDAAARRLGEPIVLPYVTELFAYVRR
jgi:SAM-dependent methyltransferase